MQSSHLSLFTRRAGVLAAVATTMLLALALYAWGTAAASPRTAQTQPVDSAPSGAAVPWQEPTEPADPTPTDEPYPQPTGDPDPQPTDEPYPGPSEEPYPGPDPSPTATEEPTVEPKPTKDSPDSGQSEPQPPAPTPTVEMPEALPETGGGGAARP